MKKLVFFLLNVSVFFLACQKSVRNVDTGMARTADSTIVAGDTLTYEVLTTDSVGWFGIWNLPNGTLGSNALESGTFGSPVYLPNGWQYSFAIPSHPFQAFISVASHLYLDDITVNLYKNRQLVKSVKSGAAAKLLLDVKTDSLNGTPASPALAYEVIVNDPDPTKAESDSWIGQWTNAKGVNSDLNNPLVSFFAIPSGWRYSFKPEQLPFTMHMAASPFTKDGGKITINFYVNGQLVKTSSSRDWIYYMDYTVQ